MDPKLTTLQLFLETLGISPNIETLDDRKRVQKAVYLGQLTGVDLGYRFSWYVMGPYSPDLTKDYYSLRDHLIDEPDESETDKQAVRLQPALTQRLKKVRPLLEVPPDVPLSSEEWYELLASVDYLQRVSRRSDQSALETLGRQKPLLAPYTRYAKAALGEAIENGIIVGR